eukprot:4077558-Alexandrium_andersonii.AAC.1
MVPTAAAGLGDLIDLLEQGKVAAVSKVIAYQKYAMRNGGSATKVAAGVGAAPTVKVAEDGTGPRPNHDDDAIPLAPV